MTRRKASSGSGSSGNHISSSIIDVGIVYRREGSCPLHIALIREVLGYIHDHLRFIITRRGLADDNEIMPAKLSIYAILNARYMDDFKAVLLGQSFRERTWPIVKSSRAYDDIAPWLKANRCPYIYDAETVETANEYGIYRIDDGDVYEGDWRNGMSHGQGKYTWPDGDVYEGGWKDDKQHGHGKYTYASGEVYEGGWKDDNKHGQGKHTWADGSVYEGGWKDHSKEGFGKMTFADGMVYEGLWKDDERSDQGRLIWPDGSIYEGELEDNQRHGNGKQTWSDGRVYIGDWVDDKMHGYGCYKCTNGRMYEGDFIDNRFLMEVELLQ